MYSYISKNYLNILNDFLTFVEKIDIENLYENSSNLRKGILNSWRKTIK